MVGTPQKIFFPIFSYQILIESIVQNEKKIPQKIPEFNYDKISNHKCGI